MYRKLRHQFLMSTVSPHEILAENKESVSWAKAEIEGIEIKYDKIPADLQTKIWIARKFQKQIRISTLNKVKLTKVINTFTMGNKVKLNNEALSEVSNFYDPNSRFKDSWFDVCLIYDRKMKDRKFMLKEPMGDPADLNNIRITAPMKIANADQTVIYLSTLKGLRTVQWAEKIGQLHFEETGQLYCGSTIDRNGYEWLTIRRQFETHSALTDIEKTSMKDKKSMKTLVGLPSKEVYRYVNPWHPVRFYGVGHVRYFNLDGNPFWAIVYYNTSTFADKTGRIVDYHDAEELLTEMFMNLSIKPVTSGKD